MPTSYDLDADDLQPNEREALVNHLNEAATEWRNRRAANLEAQSEGAQVARALTEIRQITDTFRKREVVKSWRGRLSEEAYRVLVHELGG